MDPVEQKLHKVDSVFWNSAIFSREAMVLNCITPHKYGDKRALGVFRIVAFCLMFVLFTFLTVYESLINKNRVYLTFAWYVSLGTLAFFSLSLIFYATYFKDEGQAKEKKDTEVIVHDGPHPFYSWKVITTVNCFCLQASLHLVILEVLQDSSSNQVVQVAANAAPLPLFPVRTALSFLPLTILVCDWFANRIYFPVTLVAQYSILCYSIGLLSLMIKNDVTQMLVLPELGYFEVQAPWLLPILVTSVCYALTRFKMWYLDEGDLVFNFD